MRRQASGEQGRGGQQTATTGNGIDETGNESDNGQDGQGGEVNAEFERHGIGLIGGCSKGLRGRGAILPISDLCGDRSDMIPNGIG
ncbi:hypothetical protein D3C85_719330 [compost metagenome]